MQEKWWNTHKKVQPSSSGYLLNHCGPTLICGNREGIQNIVQLVDPYLNVKCVLDR